MELIAENVFAIVVAVTISRVEQHATTTTTTTVHLNTAGSFWIIYTHTKLKLLSTIFTYPLIE